MTLPSKIIIVRSSYTATGGVERVAVSLLHGLLEKAADVTLLTQPGQHWPVFHPKLTIVEVGISRGHRLLQAWAFNRGVNQYLAKHHSDCVLSLDKVTRFSHLHAGGGTHKTFLDIRDQYDSPAARFARRFSLFHRYILYLERKGFENPLLKKVRCNSQLVMNIIQKDYAVDPDKLVLVHSGVRWREMQASYDQRDTIAGELCLKHNLDPQLKKVLFLGSGFAHKGLEVAIRGLEQMSRDYQLIVVGKGSAQRFKRLAAAKNMADRLHFLGPQANGWQYAAACKALVLPSRYDPFGGASAEGNAMGLPVLVSDKVGYADWIQDGKNGVILKMPADDRHIRIAFSKLQHLIENPVWTADRIRQHARNVDDDVILEQLMTKFF
jgi:UDP-glucose:(heptosyl)LPS alpha-1,3-glucosyltransferase